MIENEYRVYKDSFGEIKVKNDCYWQAQTQRSLEHFDIGEFMPLELIKSLLLIKKSSAYANYKIKKLNKDKFDSITNSVEYLLNEINTKDNSYIREKYFPLKVYQTGSGTQTNMNVNEVISYISLQNINCNIHPNDDVNMSQSSNDTIPTAINLMSITLSEKLINSLNILIDSLTKLYNNAKKEKYIKVGRTHLQDATPMYFYQEVYGWIGILEESKKNIIYSTEQLYFLPIGGTAIGTGINAGIEYEKFFIENLCNDLNTSKYKRLENKFFGLSSKHSILNFFSSIKNLAASLIKIANDIRWLSAGPRCSIREISIPQNEQGSSIMPGKVNPTQCEMILMICAEIIGADTTMSIAESSGIFQLNTHMPLMALKISSSINILKKGIINFSKYCTDGIKVLPKMKEYYNQSLMNITALTPLIGYDKASKIAKYAYEKNISLKDASIEFGILEEDFDKFICPKNLIPEE